MDVVKHVVPVPATVVNNLVLLVQLPAVPHPDIRDVADIFDVGNPSKEINF